MSKKKIVIVLLALLVVSGISISAIALIDRHDENKKVDMVSEELAISNDLDKEEPELQTYDEEEKKTENKKDEKSADDKKKSEEDDSKSEDGLKENNSQKKESGKNGQDNKNDTGINNNIPDDKTSTSASNNVTAPVVTEQHTTETVKPAESVNQQPVTTEAPMTTETSSGNGNNTTTEKQKVWHEAEYEDVWVVDTPAWDEDIVEYHAICNQCGLDFTSTHIDISAHQQSTITPENPTGICRSYSCGVPVVVNTIHHKEEGHYEKKLVKDGFWE